MNKESADCFQWFADSFLYKVMCFVFLMKKMRIFLFFWKKKSRFVLQE